MMVPNPQAMIDQLRSRIKDPARLAILEGLAVECLQLQARALDGQPVQAELQHMQSQSASLTATEAQVLRDAVLGWIGDVSRAVVGAAFAAA